MGAQGPPRVSGQAAGVRNLFRPEEHAMRRTHCEVDGEPDQFEADLSGSRVENGPQWPPTSPPSTTAAHGASQGPPCICPPLTQSPCSPHSHVDLGPTAAPQRVSEMFGQKSQFP